MRNTDLNAAVSAVRENLAVAVHLANIAQEIRYDLPQGYVARPDRDGTQRPVEALVIAHEDRGITAEINDAIARLNRAAAEVGNAARAMDRAINRWENKR